MSLGNFETYTGKELIERINQFNYFYILPKYGKDIEWTKQNFEDYCDRHIYDSIDVCYVGTSIMILL